MPHRAIFHFKNQIVSSHGHNLAAVYPNYFRGVAGLYARCCLHLSAGSLGRNNTKYSGSQDEPTTPEPRAVLKCNTFTPMLSKTAYPAAFYRSLRSGLQLVQIL